jgi:Neurotransmitter-gated ion-channel ligand binding domain.
MSGKRNKLFHYLFLHCRATEESFSHTDLYKTKALVSHTGEVIWTAPVTWQVSCEFDVTWFPIDRQVSNLSTIGTLYWAKLLILALFNSKLIC